MAFYFPNRLKVWLSTLLLTLACLQLCPQLQQLQLFGLYLVIQLLLTLHLLLFLTKASTQRYGIRIRCAGLFTETKARPLSNAL